MKKRMTLAEAHAVLKKMKTNIFTDDGVERRSVRLVPVKPHPERTDYVPATVKGKPHAP